MSHFRLLALLLVVSPAMAGEPTATTTAAPALASTERCDAVVADVHGSIQAAVDAMAGGGRVCVATGRYAERVHVRSGGTTARPLVIAATGAVSTEGFVVTADFVHVVGFAVTNPHRDDDAGRDFGIYLAGRGLRAEANHVWFTAADGIGCEQKAPFCPGAVIRGNVVHGAEGIGIVTYGDDVVIEANDVSGSTAYTSIDADGIRFFGARALVRANWVHDIKASGYTGGQDPHTDCFQTFPKSGFAPRDVVVADNVCERVDDQCMVADGTGDGDGATLEFRGNTCANLGSQAILSRRLPALRIVGNRFERTIKFWGVNLMDGAHSALVSGNTFVGEHQPVKADASSEPGLVVADNEHVP